MNLGVQALRPQAHGGSSVDECVVLSKALSNQSRELQTSSRASEAYCYYYHYHYKNPTTPSRRPVRALHVL